MYKVFLSSTGRDLAAYREAVAQAVDSLDQLVLVRMENFGARDVALGDFLAHALREADIFVGLIGWTYGSSPPGHSRSYVEQEYDLAGDLGIPRLMFVAPDDFPIPGHLIETDEVYQRLKGFRRRVLGASIVGRFASPEQLASSVVAALVNWLATISVSAGPPGPPLGPNPYKGLEAFRKEDASRFFGREKLVDELWRRFVDLHCSSAGANRSPRFLAILGMSGTGKSSVAQAGLIAKLERDPLPNGLKPSVVALKPGLRPLESLAIALVRRANSVGSFVKTIAEFEEILRSRSEGDGLRSLVDRMAEVGPGGLVLLVDRFEEVFAICNDNRERALFVSNLVRAARETSSPVSVLMTMRSDFLGPMQLFPELNQYVIGQSVFMPVMQEDELRRAIAEPARLAGREIDPSTVTLLVGQAFGREGVLPLLEFVLTRIWDGFSEGVEAGATLEQLGGVGGGLATEAELIYASLPADEQMIAQRAFLAMVRVNEGAENTRRRVRLSEIVAANEDPSRVLGVLHKFGAHYLVALGAESGEIVAEVAHEGVFKHWARLARWISDNRSTLRFAQRLRDAVREWVEEGRPIGLLWRPPLLDRLTEYYNSRMGNISRMEIEFLRESEAEWAIHERTREGMRELSGKHSAVLSHHDRLIILVKTYRLRNAEDVLETWMERVLDSVPSEIDVEERPAPSVFLSYAREDEVIVTEIHDDLTNNGIRSWFDKVNLITGQKWEDAIQVAIESCDIVLIFLVEAVSIRKDMCRRKLRRLLISLIICLKEVCS